MRNELDTILQSACPLVPVPLHGDLVPMTDNGQRILVAANGVFVQVKRDWIEVVHPIGEIERGFPLPYGRMNPALRLAFGALPVALLGQFARIARAALPNEVAAVVVWSACSRTLRLLPCESLRAGPEHVKARVPALAPDESVVLDLHSHGTAAAFFSSIDDADDSGFNLCGVLGHLHTDWPSAVFRLCINGFKAYPALPWDRTHLPWRTPA